MKRDLSKKKREEDKKKKEKNEKDRERLRLRREDEEVCSDLIAYFPQLVDRFRGRTTHRGEDDRTSTKLLLKPHRGMPSLAHWAEF